jgi:hypothetical protein
MSRPFIDPADRRDTIVTTRITEQESLLLEKFAWAEGITTSTAIRWIMCGCLSDSSARAEAIEAGNNWIDSSTSNRMQAMMDSATRFREEAKARIAKELQYSEPSEVHHMQTGDGYVQPCAADEIDAYWATQNSKA